MTRVKFLIYLTIFLFCAHSVQTQSLIRLVKPGIEVLKEDHFSVLKGKRVGLLTNPTGVDSKLNSTVDILYNSPEVNLIALFGPEHGVRGDHAAGETVRTRRDPVTGIPIYSLYGKNKKPAPQSLKDIDALIYDIQDIGVRSYTYISTMGKAMEAAAEANIEFVVLDRPNPLGGQKIEGNIAEEAFFSMVGAYPIPYVYGLTAGELAKMINAEGWLKNGITCDLKVIPMKGWTRDMHFEDTHLPWVPSSPHIPHPHKAPYYVATGILGELGVINIGVGYTLPFELFGANFINPQLLAGPLNTYYKGDVIFRSITYNPYYGKMKGIKLHGLQIYIMHPDAVNLMSIQFKFLEIFHSIYPNINVLAESEERHGMFDKVCGTSRIREVFFQKYRYKDILPIIQKDVKAFRKKSEKYYLYQ